MSKLEQLKEKAKGLEAKDPRKAVEIWLEALSMQESDGEANPDLSIYNRIGDLYIKLKDPGLAADYYDQAVDRYAELGFHNNAIAMCNKVLRNAPARQATYLKLAKLYGAKGFIAEAKQNFVEYAERMQKIGKIEHAFAALKEFTDISPESKNLREMLAEHLKMYGTDPGKRASSSTPAAPAGPRVSAPGAPKPPPDDIHQSAKRKTSSLVFLDLDEPRTPKGGGGGGGGGAKAAPPPPPKPEPPEATEPESLTESLVESTKPDPEESAPLEIERTSLVDESPGAGGGSGLLEGFETTVADFGQTESSAPKTPSIRDDINPKDLDLDTLPELETTAEPPRHAPPAPAPAADSSADVPGLDDADLVLEGNVVESPPPPPAKKSAPPPAKKPAPVKPVVPKQPTAGNKRKPAVEVPPLELEPDFQTATTDAGHDVDDEPLTLDEAPPSASPPRHPSFIQTEDDTSISAGGRRSGFIDLGVDEISQGDHAGSLVFSNIEATPAAPEIEELESRVADNPDDPEAHQALGEALIEQGERERGIEELDLATGGFENAGNLSEARDLVDEILHLDPNSVRHRQKAVEYAFKAGDKPKLIDAYLELADALLRSDLPEKARAVYARVAEHDPKNERAKGALSMLAPAVGGAAGAGTAGRAGGAPSKPEGKVKAKDAKLKVRDETAADGDFVDLGSMLTEEDEDMPARDTRMTVADEEPTGDEEQDFQDMLARFKQGIDENIDEADFQSHYDLGVAFKEMGLLDEAIAEFQKALRAPEGKLRTSEMLGICFFEKGAFGVAESILRRGLDLPASGDQERLGVLYWLGRALEQQGKKADARDLYGRVFAVDIRFLDAEQRVKALAKAK
ncbi:MAG TPA: tetratricopeptide repeat protein [Gemmatimonadales bacterium]|nr:tetratricopeptide repeat protein [Gemmatimonadales bacterium]